MKLFFKSFLILLGVLQIQGCCSELDETFCLNQVFTETINVPMSFTYQVNSSKPFIEAKKITAADVKNALKVGGTDFKLKSVELISGAIKFSKDPTNACRTLNVNLGVVASSDGFEYALLRENQVLPLFDIPPIPYITEGIKLNDYLNGKGVLELKKILKNYATIINDGTISFILRGEGLPSASLVKFNLFFDLKLSVTYEVCRYAPMGKGDRVCEE
ncbi:MAG: hypothetical protein ABI761_16505 [Saprospiraceae bacterium]